MSIERVSWDADPDGLRRHLEAGGVLAIPTESSYGLAADPRNAAGVEAIYRLKERDRGKPLPVVAADLGQLSMLGIDSESPVVAAVAEHWPAALSLVVAASGPDGPWPAAADGATLAVRIPAHGALRGLLTAVQCPLTATSANIAGGAPILAPDELEPFLDGHSVCIVDGGRLAGGEPSTLVTWQGDQWQVIRPGRFAVEDLADVGGDIGRP